MPGFRFFSDEAIVWMGGFMDRARCFLLAEGPPSGFCRRLVGWLGALSPSPAVNVLATRFSCRLSCSASEVSLGDRQPWLDNVPRRESSGSSGLRMISAEAIATRVIGARPHGICLARVHSVQGLSRQQSPRAEVPYRRRKSTGRSIYCRWQSTTVYRNVTMWVGRQTFFSAVYNFHM